MNKQTPIDYFTQDMARNYDEKNKKLSAISECMHFLSNLVLADIPEEANILCVGVGTGAEILSLSKHHPKWTFVGVDPSNSMLEVCKERLEKAGVLDRCQLLHGYVTDVPVDSKFDVALSILVGHFIKKEDRVNYYQAMSSRVKANGTLINTEISFDLNSTTFPQMLVDWKQVQTLMGATPESLANLPNQLRDSLTVLPPEQVEKLLVESGLVNPVKFFQAFMISGWHSKVS
jgi:tRNA (cmo5U34)-methyltransferase